LYYVIDEQAVVIFQGPSNLQVDSLDLADEPHPRFPVPGHILSFGGDALIQVMPTTLSFTWFLEFKISPTTPKAHFNSFEIFSYDLI
jgi:hypothetical protein